MSTYEETVVKERINRDPPNKKDEIIIFSDDRETSDSESNIPNKRKII